MTAKSKININSINFVLFKEEGNISCTVGHWFSCKSSISRLNWNLQNIGSWEKKDTTEYREKPESWKPTNQPTHPGLKFGTHYWGVSALALTVLSILLPHWALLEQPPQSRTPVISNPLLSQICPLSTNISMFSSMCSVYLWL